MQVWRQSTKGTESVWVIHAFAYQYGHLLSYEIGVIQKLCTKLYISLHGSETWPASKQNENDASRMLWTVVNGESTQRRYE